MECWKNLVKGLLSGLASSLSTNGDILSGPGALRELRAWSILKTPSSVTLISGAVGTLQSPFDGILGSSSLPKNYYLLSVLVCCHAFISGMISVYTIPNTCRNPWGKRNWSFDHRQAECPLCFNLRNLMDNHVICDPGDRSVMSSMSTINVLIETCMALFREFICRLLMFLLRHAWHCSET